MMRQQVREKRGDREHDKEIVDKARASQPACLRAGCESVFETQIEAFPTQRLMDAWQLGGSIGRREVEAKWKLGRIHTKA